MGEVPTFARTQYPSTSFLSNQGHGAAPRSHITDIPFPQRRQAVFFRLLGLEFLLTARPAVRYARKQQEYWLLQQRDDGFVSLGSPGMSGRDLSGIRGTIPRPGPETAEMAGPLDDTDK